VLVVGGAGPAVPLLPFFTVGGSCCGGNFDSMSTNVTSVIFHGNNGLRIKTITELMKLLLCGLCDGLHGSTSAHLIISECD